MPPIIETIEIARPPDEVFPYATDPSRFSEWQKGVVSAGLVGGGPAAVGARCTTTRRIGASERTSTQEITELAAPHRWAVRGIDGPIRANIAVTIDPIDDGRGSRLTISLDFVGQGLGRMIVPAVRREAAKEAPSTCHALKLRLESGSPATA
jgi:uncharacterized protein YndB with AHSA1/START domain